MNKDAAFLQGKQTQQRLIPTAVAGRHATFTGQNPHDAAVITYYQRSGTFLEK